MVKGGRKGNDTREGDYIKGGCPRQSENAPSETLSQEPVTQTE